MDRGSLILLSFAAVILGYQALKGWRLGPVRQIVRFGALVGAYATGLLGSTSVVPFLRPLLSYPDFILRCIGGAGLGLLAYLFICLVGGILFKRTAHQNMGLIWFVYGATGALLGVAFGLVLLLVCADALRFLGGIAEARTALAAPPASPKKGHAPGATAAKPTPGLPPPPSGLALVVEMKTALESHLPGEVLQAIDPVPKKAYNVAGKIGRTLADPDAATRFLSFPETMELVTRPEIKALRNDPEILRLVQERQFNLLLKNEKIIQASNDPQIAALLRKFELEKALDHALKK